MPSHPCSFAFREAVLQDAAEITQVHIRAWKETYQGIIEQNFLDSISFEQWLKQRKQILSKHSETEKNWVACNQGEIIGFCDIGKKCQEEIAGAGQIYAIYILKRFQRKGIGSALWKQSVHHFVTHGLTSFHVLVLEHNWPARRFYERQKGSVKHVEVITIGQCSYREVCYSFRVF